MEVKKVEVETVEVVKRERGLFSWKWSQWKLRRLFEWFSVLSSVSRLEIIWGNIFCSSVMHYLTIEGRPLSSWSNKIAKTLISNQTNIRVIVKWWQNRLIPVCIDTIFMVNNLVLGAHLRTVQHLERLAAQNRRQAALQTRLIFQRGNKWITEIFH